MKFTLWTGQWTGQCELDGSYYEELMCGFHTVEFVCVRVVHSNELFASNVWILEKDARKSELDNYRTGQRRSIAKWKVMDTVWDGLRHKLGKRKSENEEKSTLDSIGLCRTGHTGQCVIEKWTIDGWFIEIDILSFDILFERYRDREAEELSSRERKAGDKLTSVQEDGKGRFVVLREQIAS